MSSPHATRPTRAEIDLAALAFNYRSVRKFVGDEVEFMAVVKANAYGHGAVECARRLEAEGVDWFAVATLEEAIELREAKVFCPILVLGGIWPGQEAALLNHSLTPTVFRLDQVKSLAGAAARQGITARVHVKIDTGMNRVGFRREEWPEAARSLSQSENIEVDGLMTHFAAADKLDETDFTNQQMASFAEAVEIFQSHGHRPMYIDMANSPGAVVHPLSRAKLVRIGGLLYGLGGDVLPAGVDQPELKPVMSIRSKVALVKTVRKGESVGYSRIFIAKRDSVIATVPIGYHDGLPRALSTVGHFLIEGQRAPIAGRISMDWTTLDVTDNPDVRVGDEVTIIGGSDDQIIRAEDIAALTGTISYEITCGIGSRVPRAYCDPKL